MTISDEDAKGLFLTTGLYAKVAVDRSDKKMLGKLKTDDVQFDCYCVWCKQSSTFSYRGARGSGSGRYQIQDWELSPSRFLVELSCGRVPQHLYTYLFVLTNDHIEKVGQYPSLESIASSDLKRFRGILSKEYFSELHRAGGLFSHGIGIGSFVYLRRIFEKLIKDAKNKYQAGGGDVASFERLRMAEKIDALREFLPSSLVKNSSVYGILSQGVHELDEETCIKYFPVIRAGIVQMLEQALQEKAREEAARELERQVAAISSELGRDKKLDSAPQSVANDSEPVTIPVAGEKT